MDSSYSPGETIMESPSDDELIADWIVEKSAGTRYVSAKVNDSKKSINGYIFFIFIWLVIL